ncbi:MAG: hypothetical protein K2N01_09795 [Lachnospiraceae bacterium]|nr:hypothetical protein [Lachnospiraceae bacterium]
MRKSRCGHRKQKNIAALLLSVILAGSLLAGCSKSDEDSGLSGNTGGRGRFVEEEVSLPQGMSEILTMRTLSDGRLALVAADEVGMDYFLLHSSDMGANWESIPIRNLNAEQIWVSKAAIAPDGSAALYGLDLGGAESRLWKVGSDGSAKIIPLELPEYEDDGVSGKTFSYQMEADGSNPSDEAGAGLENIIEGTEEGLLQNFVNYNDIQQMAYDEAGNLLCLDLYGQVYRMNLKDGSLEDAFALEGEEIRYFGISGNTFLGSTGEELLLFDTVSGERMDEEPVLDESVQSAQNNFDGMTLYSSASPMVFAAEAKDPVVYATGNGIFSYQMGGSVSEQLVDGALTSLSNPDNGLQSITMPDENHIFVVLSGIDGSQLLRFSYDPDASAAPDQELKIYAMEDSMALRQAITLFREKHSNVYVNLQIGLSEEGVTREDALTALNTDIMAGNGPDVLILDGMQPDSYIEKEILTDLSDVIRELEEQDGLFSGICNAYEGENGIYAVPTRFLVPVAAGNRDGVNASSELKTLAAWAEGQKDAEIPVMANMEIDKLLRILYDSASADWQREDGSLDEAQLSDFLANAKALADTVGTAESEAISYSSFGSLWNSDVAIQDSMLDGMHLLMGESQIELGELAGIENFRQLASILANTDGSYAQSGDLGAGTFVPYLTVGVLAKGNTEMGKEFVRELMGKDLVISDAGFPVNRAAYKAGCESAMEDNDQYSEVLAIVDESGQMREVKILPLTQAQVDEITALLENISVPCLADETIESQVLEQAGLYIAGDQELEETVGNIQQKVDLYLAE